MSKPKYQVTPGNQKEQKNLSPKPEPDEPRLDTEEKPAQSVSKNIPPLVGAFAGSSSSSKYWEQKTYKLPPDISQKLKLASSILGVHERDIVLAAIQDKLEIIGPDVQSKMKQSLQEW